MKGFVVSAHHRDNIAYFGSHLSGVYMKSKLSIYCIGTTLILGVLVPGLLQEASYSRPDPFRSIEFCSTYPVLFEHDNFRGKHIILQFSTERFVNFNDVGSSVCVPAGWSVSLYEHDTFQGRALTVNSGDWWSDLKRNRPSNENWGDRISSVRVSRWDESRQAYLECTGLPPSYELPSICRFDQ